MLNYPIQLSSLKLSKKAEKSIDMARKIARSTLEITLPREVYDEAERAAYQVIRNVSYGEYKPELLLGSVKILRQG